MAHCLIVGGTKGLGLALSRILGKRGDIVSIIGRTETTDTDRKQDKISYWYADLDDRTGLLGVLGDIISKRGEINYLVFCQRYRGEGDKWDGELSVSLSATRLVIDTLEPSFATGEDNCIVMVSSVFGTFVGEGQDISYHVTRAGLTQMAKYYAINLAKKGIRVNSISPSTFLKDESRQYYLNNQPLMELYEEILPLGKLPSADDIANVITFLCSPNAKYVNGQNIFVDGGLSLVWPETLARRLRSI